MDPIEHYLNRVSQSVGGSEDLRRHLREELREHIEDLVRDYQAQGLSREQAAAKALESLGEPETMREGMEAVHGRRPLAFLIEKAMEWKESTMKTGWKWSFAGNFFLIATILSNIFVFFFIATKIVPRVLAAAQYKAVGLPQFLVNGLHSMNLILHWWGGMGAPILLLLLIAAGWAAFEWGVKGENKGVMRLGVGALISLILTIFTGYYSVIVFISAAILMAPH
jgi:hypothetical protein